MTATPTTRVRARPAAAGTVDALAVVVFVLIGRQTHDEQDVLAGIARTAWPFLLALVLAWLLTRAWRAPFAPLRTGVPVALLTVALGMVLRTLAGQGTAVPFVVVATVFLTVVLAGWRAIMAAWQRRASDGGAHDVR